MDIKGSVIQELITGLNARDERIQERVYKYYWGFLMGISTRYFNDRNIAREVVNDSFIKIFNKMYDFQFNGDAPDFEKTFKSWLKTITVRTALDKLRANKTLLNYVEEYEEHETSTVNVEHQLFAEDILRLMDSLSDLQRTVFNLYEIEGFSHDEIAIQLTIPVSTSRTYLSRAKQKLRELYLNSIKISNGTVE